MAEKIKVGILGLGRAGRGMHMSEMGRYPDKFEIVAGCDIDPDQIEAARKVTPNARYYTDMKELFADPEVELVTVATRSLDHVNHALMAFEAGKKVLCEKPVTPSVAEFDRLWAAEKSRPGSIFIRHNRRFEAAFTQIRDIIASGKLGWVYEIKLARNSFQWRADWQTFKEFGGGQLLNWGPHIIDHSLRFLESPVKSIWSNLKLVAARADAEDHIKIVFEGENGRIVDMEISGGVALDDPVYVIHGTRGSLISYDEQRLKLKYMNPAVPIPDFKSDPGNPKGYGAPAKPAWVEDDLQVAPANGNDTYVIWSKLYDSIREGKPFPIKFEEAREVVRVTELVRQGAIDNVRDRKF